MEQKVTESQLLEKVKASEMGAFQMLFKQYQPVILRYAVFYIRRTDIAQDIVQETFIQVWNHRSSLKPHRKSDSRLCEAYEGQGEGG